MLAAESKVVAAGVADVPHSEQDCSWKHIVEPVEPFLEAVNRRLARQVNEFDPNLAQYAEYALNGNGKHLRPTLVALAANSLGRINDSHVTVAVIIEMVHLATLVHDDVMDEAEIRRGISGNLCRCTGYVNIVKAIQFGAAKLRGESPVSTQQEPSATHA